MSKYDSIIIGSGINSLVVAALLGKQNKKVLVLESREQIGGLSSTIELKQGFKCNAIHDSLKWIDPRVMKTLKLQDHGLKIIKEFRYDILIAGYEILPFIFNASKIVCH